MSVMITTVDNPYDPFTQFREWYAFDEQKGYHTCSLLDRFVKSSYELTIQEQNTALEQGIDEIIKTFGLGLYKKIHLEDKKQNKNDEKGIGGV